MEIRKICITKGWVKLKKVLIIFFVIIGLVIAFNTIRNLSWLPFVGGKTETEVTDKIDQIKFDLKSAKVEVIVDDRDTVKAELDGRGKVSVDRSGDTITVDYSQPWPNFFSFFNTPELKVYIPEDYEEDIHIDMGSGQLTFSGDSKKLNELTINLSSGNVKLENLSVSHLSLEASSGNITTKALTTEKSSIDISSGRIQLKDFKGELDVDLSSGIFDAQFAELVAPIDVSVSSGTVTLDLPDNSDFTLKSKVGSGRVSFDAFPMEVKKQDGKKFEGTHGKGTHEINIDVSSGIAKIK